MMLHYGPKRNYWIVILSFFIALLLTVLPLPHVALYFRPEWIFLVLVYWLLALPERVGIGTAWILGLFLDVIMHSLLGAHAMSLIITAYIIIHWRERLKLFPLIQQSIIVGIILAIYLVLNLLLKNVSHPISIGLGYWLPLITTTVLWPLISIILTDVQKKGRII